MQIQGREEEMKNGSYFERSYIPDEHKKIVGPIEHEIDDPIMQGAVIKIAFWIAVIAGGIAFLFAITGGISA